MHIARVLSLDIAVSACVCTLFIAKFLNVTLPFSCVLALGICLWLIYTADHLIDARRIKHRAHSARHYFHQKHFETITTILLLVGLSSISILFFLPTVVIKWGIVLCLLVGAYFLLLFWLRPVILFQKEVSAAILYASGVFLAPVSLSQHPFTSDLTIVFIQFLCIVLTNLIAFSLLDKELDQADGHVSFVTLAGPKVTRQLLTCLGTIVTGSTLFFLIYFPLKSPVFKVEVLLLGMSLTLLVMALKPSILGKSEIYRIVGDSIFFYPLVMLLF